MGSSALTPRKIRRLVGAGGLLLLVAALAAAALPQAAVNNHSPASKAALTNAYGLSAAFREAAKEVQPSVVLIRNQPAMVSTSGWNGKGAGNLPEASPFGDLLKDPRLRQFFSRPPTTPREGIGSGVIIDASGLILTNNHVVAGDGKVTVRLHDGRVFEAVDVKADPETDLAIVRIKGAKDLKAARLGNSDAVEIGDWVLALGQPFGLEGTVTAGIISAKGRGIGITPRENFLQTDAAINPGNSGGPLVNLAGEVIGINTAISSRSGGSQGVGFAVPVNLAKWVSNQLVKNGKVERAQLGIMIQPVTYELGKQFGVQSNEGVLVASVVADSPAAKAGLKEGDVVLEFAGKKVTSPQQLQSIVERVTPGTKQTLKILRDGKEMAVSAVCGEQTESMVAETGPGGERMSRFDRLGLEVGQLTGDVAEQLGMTGVKGIVITSVRPGSAADGAGLVAGMVITEANRKPVKSVTQFRGLVKSDSIEKGLLLLVRTPEGARFVVLKP
jgi:serine protease Do